MYKGFRLFVIFSVLILLNGCSSSCGSAVEPNSNDQTNQVIVPKRADNANLPANTNANLVNGMVNSNGKNPTLDNTKVKVIDTTNVKPSVPKVAMPDNSEISVQSVGENFVETRKFLKNPQLDKLEKIMNGKEVKIKVYLKNGKVFEMDEKKLKDYRNDSAATILQAVGVKPQTDPKADNKAQESKSKSGLEN